jgi:glycerophosphoryl diester phosphodiesterase
MELLLPQGTRPHIIGHRGALDCAPENTMASFREALAQGADLIELDVQMSADGQLVVIHDQTLERTTNGRGLVADTTLAEIQALDAGSWFSPEFAGERVPELSEVLAWIKGKAGLAIEIKNGPIFYEGIEQKIVGALKRYDMIEHTIVISFDHPCLYRIKKLCPELNTGILVVSRLLDPVTTAGDVGATAIVALWALVTRADVEVCHGAGLAVSTWGSHNPDYEYLLSISVDALTADHPAAVWEIVRERYPSENMRPDS